MGNTDTLKITKGKDKIKYALNTALDRAALTSRFQGVSSRTGIQQGRHACQTLQWNSQFLQRVFLHALEL